MMESRTTTIFAPAQMVRRAALAGFLGSLMEWYDFYLFGTAAALVFGRLFFPSSSPATGTLAAFAAFAVGFISRPIGAVIFGHVGDRIGRKYALLATAALMGVGTFMIGVLPTYETIGVWAPILLVVLRLLQGLGIGGEWGGAALIALEHAPSGRRGLVGSFPQMGTPAGLLISTGAFALATLLPGDTFLAWGWRLPFLLSVVFLAPALYIRSRVEETPAFRAMKEADAPATVPVLDLFQHSRRNMLLATGARLADAATFNVINVFGIAYAAAQLGVSRGLMLTGFVIAAAVEIPAVPLIGMLSDRIGRRPVYLAGIAFSGLFIFAYFPLLQHNTPISVYLAIVLALAVGTSLMYAIQSSFFSELFGPSVRYTGISVAYQLSALVGGAPTPLIAAALVDWAGGAWWPVALYLLAVCGVSFVCVCMLAETSWGDLPGASHT